jgi:hypothetical protein
MSPGNHYLGIILKVDLAQLVVTNAGSSSSEQWEIQTDPFDGVSDNDLAAIVALAQSQTAGVA